ncbi:hypothetical protein Ddc_00795 [Ditylenchus destructor]|nr:hypothetical protein Ddc_00795 [Ditylenchus destructor]
MKQIGICQQARKEDCSDKKAGREHSHGLDHRVTNSPNDGLLCRHESHRLNLLCRRCFHTNTESECGGGVLPPPATIAGPCNYFSCIPPFLFKAMTVTTSGPAIGRPQMRDRGNAVPLVPMQPYWVGFYGKA